MKGYKGLIKKSRTLDFNVLVALLVGVEQNLPILKSMIPAGAYSWLFFGVVIVNIVLRFKTSGPVGIKA